MRTRISTITTTVTNRLNEVPNIIPHNVRLIILRRENFKLGARTVCQ
jgi:hypothetical protein